MNKPIKVMLVDDHAVVRAGFTLLLAASGGIEVSAEADRGEQACGLYLEKRPDVVVMDLSMPGIGGLDAIRRIRHRDVNAKILVFSIHDETVYVDRALQAGAKGYITKSSAPEILADAILCVAAGDIYVEAKLRKQPPNSNNKPPFDLSSFSPREFDIFRLLAKGLTVREIAEELSLGYKTVANYSTQIRNKLQVNSLAELAHIAIALGVMKS